MKIPLIDLTLMQVVDRICFVGAVLSGLLMLWELLHLRLGTAMQYELVAVGLLVLYLILGTINTSFPSR